jgi:hypothetical protein
MAGYIPDGFTASIYLAEIPRVYEAVRARYRPLLAEDRAEFLAQEERLAPRQRERAGAKMLEAQLVDWDLHDDQGQPLPVKVDVILRLQPLLRRRLSLIVLGLDSGDEDDQADATTRQQRDQDLAEAQRQGRPVGDVADDRASGN